MMEEQNVRGTVFDIDHFVVHDGEGIRTCVYLKGCPLHCIWCHSPESQEKKPQILFAENRCSRCGLCVRDCPQSAQCMEERERHFLREACIMCGACVKVCPTGALSISGREYTVAEVAGEVLTDKVFFKNSGGGVTISGGEALMQAEFTLALLKVLKENGIHTILETTGYGDTSMLLEMASYTDIFFYDYKLGEKEAFRRYIGGDVDVVIQNLKQLRGVTDKIVLRLPVVPGITDTQENIDNLYGIARGLGICQIHFLPYNMSAGAKYAWCGRTYGLGELRTDMGKLRRYVDMAPENISVTIMD